MTQDNQDAGTARPFFSLAKICGIRATYDKKDLLVTFAKGLHDLPVPVDCRLTGDQHRTGLLAMAGQFTADDFKRALILTGSGGVVESRECMIDPKFIWRRHGNQTVWQTRENVLQKTWNPTPSG